MVRSILFLLCLAPNAFGQITLSEVLSNEPAGRVRLEWIELFNRDFNEVDLSGFILIVDSDSTVFPPGTIIEGQSFAVVARQPLPQDGSDSFEAYWGDSSGVWGDFEFENYSLLDGNFGLNNNSGTVSIGHTAGAILDQFNWNSPSDDARSVEKDDLDLDFTAWHDCFDPSGSTPGRANSLIPLSGPETFAVNIQPRVMSSGELIRFNVTALIPPGSKLSIDVYDDSGLKRKTLLSDVESVVIETAWNGLDETNARLLPGIYIIVASLSGRRADHKQIPVVIAP